MEEIAMKTPVDCTLNKSSKSSARKFAIGCSAVALTLFVAAGAGLAKPAAGGGGGHPAGGGGGHPAGGGGGGHPAAAAHFSAPHVSASHASAPHFSASHASAPHFHAAHIGGSRSSAGHAFARVHATPHASHFSAASSSHVAHSSSSASSRLTHVTPSGRTTAHSLTAGAHALPNARAAAFHANPRAFAARRQFAANAAFRPFWGHGWHPHNHLGWVGPLFWPYAYGDFFYYALWPYDYADVDPFWAYGYGDIYQAIFSPYDYGEYVQGPGAPERMASLTQGMAQSCADEAAEVTGWPIDQIEAAVAPSEQQAGLLDNLGNALVKASDEVKAHCPITVSFAPTVRLGAMQQRLQALVDAVNIVRPPLDKFYASLNDEQKSRFNGIQPPAPQNAKAPPSREAAASPQAQCNSSVLAWPSDQIDRVVHPNDAQRTRLDALQSAAAQAADTIKTACPTELPATPPARLAVVGKRMEAILGGVKTVRPVLSNFYDSLSDEQKARFDGMGRQLFAAN
jgi:hypothetical protein